MFDIKQYMQKNCRIDDNGNKIPIIIEAGAADGIDTLDFSNMFPLGKIFSFEPCLSEFQKAKKRVDGRNNVVLNNKALSTYNGKQSLNVADRFGESFCSHSLLNPKIHLTFHKDITFKEQNLVDVVNLDDYLKENNINYIDYMWLDMQGYESVILQNSPYAMSITKYIYSEVLLMELYENNMLYPEYKKFMESKGFFVIVEDIPWQDAGNVLFGRK